MREVNKSKMLLINGHSHFNKIIVKVYKFGKGVMLQFLLFI